MPRRRTQAAAVVTETLILAEPLPVPDLEETTVQEYQKLNDKLDDVMMKIKGRKESKRKK